MATIHIKSIGPIKDTGVLQLRTVNLFIGKQSTGKSTLLKIMSYCRWLEKLLCVGKPKNGRGVKYTYTHNYRFIQELLKFYRFDPEFFSVESEIIYVGDTYRIEFKGGVKTNPRIEAIEGATPYNVKLSFIPSERNLISAIKDIESWYRPKDFDVLFNFIFEWDEVRATYTPENALPLVVTPQLEYYYDKNIGEQLRTIDGRKNFSPFYASSGVQSALPLEVMVNALVKTVGTKANLSKTDLMDIVNAILKEDESFNKDSVESRIAKDLLIYKGAVFFIEEPEQNLFPESQANILYHMIGAIKKANDTSDYSRSMLSIASHSPYILSTLNVLMAASEAYAIDPASTVGIIPEEYILEKGSIAAYWISEDGYVSDAIDSDIYMVDGTFIDGVSQHVEDSLDRLNDIICRS
jgi:hypothetical protein